MSSKTFDINYSWFKCMMYLHSINKDSNLYYDIIIKDQLKSLQYLSPPQRLSDFKIKNNTNIKIYNLNTKKSIKDKDVNFKPETILLLPPNLKKKLNNIYFNNVESKFRKNKKCNDKIINKIKIKYLKFIKTFKNIKKKNKQ